MSIPPGPWGFKLAAEVIPAVPPPTIKTLCCVPPAIIALPSNWPARCGLGHSLAKHRIIILNPMSIAVQHAHEGRRFFASAPPPRQNLGVEGVGLIRLRFRGMLWRGLASWSDFVSGGTESSRTRRWRKPDSNPRSRVTRPRSQDRLMSPLLISRQRERVGANMNRHRCEDESRHRPTMLLACLYVPCSADER